MQARFAATVEAADEAIISGSLEGLITSWNAGAERLYGYSVEEALGQPISMTYPPDLPAAQTRGILERLRHGGKSEQLETVRVKKSGARVEVAMTVFMTKDGSGQSEFAAIVRDLTEHRQTQTALRHCEEQLRQAQKMDAISRLAGGVAHDFNNMLSVILSYTSLVLEELKPNEPIRADIEEVKKAGERAAELTRHPASGWRRWEWP